MVKNLNFIEPKNLLVHNQTQSIAYHTTKLNENSYSSIQFFSVNMPMNTQKHDTSDCKNQHHLLCSPDEPKLARRFLPPLEGLGISSVKVANHIPFCHKQQCQSTKDWPQGKITFWPHPSLNTCNCTLEKTYKKHFISYFFPWQKR